MIDPTWGDFAKILTLQLNNNNFHTNIFMITIVIEIS